MTRPQDREQDAAAPTGPAGIDALLRRLVADACRLDPAAIEADQPLAEYGLSSRDAVGIAGELEERMGRQLPSTLLWENPTLSALVRSLTGDSPEPSEAADAAGAAEDGAASSRSDRGPIAVVGIGCRLPGGVAGPDAFWDLLVGDGDAVGEVPAERWRDFGVDTAANAATLSPAVRRGAYLDDVAGFDARFFGITPREARLMDPQQRLLLEVAWEALDHAGTPAPTLQGSSTGVYVGLSSLEYGMLTTADLSRVTEWTSTGSAGSIAANRLSYAFDLRGPSVTLDSACSSSLVAVHQACRALQSGECDTALAAGVNTLLSPMVTAGFEQAGVLAANGRCRPFDAAAEGIVRGEGCGVVVLMRLDDALRDGQPILAVIRGTAVNSDGRSAGLVAPNPVAQQALLRAALRDAGVDAATVDYVETHGTGTLLGDPIEAGALSAVLGRRPADRPLLIGSVKSNLGHLEGAAGIVGLIKTVLSLRHGKIPATLHFQNPNPHIDFAGGRLRVVSELTPWPVDEQRPARAGVSAFGFGGTNAHAVVEQWREQVGEDGAVLAAPPDESAATATQPTTPQATAPATPQATPPSPATSTAPEILVVSARSGDRLGDAALGLAAWLTGPAGRRTPLADLTHTLGNNRYGSVCAAVVGRDREALAEGLRALGQKRAAKGVVGPRPANEPPAASGAGPVFVFSGYGSQWAGMGRRLLEEDPAFAVAVRELDPVFVAGAGRPLSRLVSEGVPLTDVARVQPMLYGLQLALAGMWQSYGVTPAAVVGHSMGEVAAAVVAGALDPADGLRVILRRSELLGSIDADRGGAMAAVELRPDERAETLGRFPGVEVAVDASPMRCTVTGPAEAVGRLVDELSERGQVARLLDVGGAGHSAAVDSVLPALRSAFADIGSRRPVIPWYGTVLDDPRQVPPADADYWCLNARRAVRLRQAVTAAAEDGHRAFLEISPHPVAALPVRETLDEAAEGEPLVLPTLLRDSDEPLAVRTSLAALHTAGVQRSPGPLWPAGRRTALPTTPWRHVRHWADAGAGAKPTVPTGGHPVLGARLDVPGTRRILWRGGVATDGRPGAGHEVHGTPVLTLATAADMVLHAATEVFGTAADDIVVRDLALNRFLPLPDSTPVTTLLDPIGPGRATVGLHTRSDLGTWSCHATATVEAGAPHDDEAGTEPAEGTFTVPFPPPQQDGPSTDRPLRPALLDACLGAPASAAGGPEDAVPVMIRELRVSRPAGAPVTCRVRPSPDSGEEGDAGEVGKAADAGEEGANGGGSAPGGWNVRLVDADGAAVVTAEGVVLRVPESHEVPALLSDMSYDLVWEKSALSESPSTGPSDWLVLTAGPPEAAEGAAVAEGAEDGAVAEDGDALGLALRERGGSVAVTRCAAANAGRTATTWQEGLADGASAAVVLLCTGPVGPAGAREANLVCADVARALASSAGPGRPPRLFLVTERAAVVTEGEPGDPDRACLRGLLRVLALEHPELRPCLVDVDRLHEEADDLAGELAGDGDADLVAWRAEIRFTARLARADPGREAAQVPFARPHGAYIVTGGLSGLGLATARRLAEHGAGRLVLNGRRAPAAATEAELRELRALGTEVEVVRGDIADPGTAARLVTAAVRHGHALRGVAHAAGVLKDGTIAGLTAEDLDVVFRPKVDGGRHLDEATAGHALDWWLVFSSAAALLGSPGQAAYAAANAWLEALVSQRRAGGSPGQSIAWGPWAGTGAAPDMTALALEPIAPDEGLDALQLIVAGGRPSTGVVRLDLRRAVQAFPGIESVPFFADLMHGVAEDVDDEWSADTLSTLDGDSALTQVRRRLAQRVGALMGFAEDEIDTAAPLTDLGLDSLMAVRIRNAVKQDFGVGLSETVLLRGGTLDDVAVTLLSGLDVQGAPTAAEDQSRSQGQSQSQSRKETPVPRTVLPRDAAERLVAGVWTQLSGHPPDGVHGELPAVRTDAGLAAAFAARIEARLMLGNSGPAPTVDHIQRKPTVGAVADLVRPALEGSAGESLRVLRDPGGRTDREPLFVFHPAGGSTSVYLPLTALLPPGQPVYGLDRVEPLLTVEDKAEHYLDLIRRIQPEGPYRLLGWSFGGCLAYEAAVRLRKSGERVGYLGLIDTILPAALSGPSSEDILVTRFARFAEYVETAYGRRLELPYQEMAGMDEQGQIDTLMGHVSDAGLDMSPGVMEHQRTSYVDARIGERYRPGPYPGPVVLYRAQDAQVLTTAIDPRYLRDDPDLGWAPLCAGLRVVSVPGDHLSLIDPPHVDAIARHLNTALDEDARPRKKKP